MSGSCGPDPVLEAIETLRAFVRSIPNPGHSKRLEQVRASDHSRLNEWEFVRLNQLPVGEQRRNGLRAV